MEIGARGYPQAALSNFIPRAFYFDGVLCASMEGLLQAFKFELPHIQEEVCKLVGRDAKFRGKKRNKRWRQQQTLWWKGVAYPRDSEEYQQLLDRAFEAMFEQNEAFRRALFASGRATLTHSIGKSKESETVLTEREFCSRLTRLRESLKRKSA